MGHLQKYGPYSPESYLSSREGLIACRKAEPGMMHDVFWNIHPLQRSLLISGKAALRSFVRGKRITHTKAGSWQRQQPEKPRRLSGWGGSLRSLFTVASPRGLAALCSHLQLLLLSCSP